MSKGRKAALSIIGVLIVLVSGLLTFIYLNKDKVAKEDNKTNNTNVIDNKDKEEQEKQNNNNNNKNTYTVNSESDIVLGKTDDNVTSIKQYFYGEGESEETPSTTLILLDNGSFYTLHLGEAPYGDYGTYEIEDNKITLTALYSHGSGCGFDKKSNTIVYDILEDGSVKTANQNYSLVEDKNRIGTEFQSDGECTESLEEANAVYNLGFTISFSGEKEYIFNGNTRTISLYE